MGYLKEAFKHSWQQIRSALSFFLAFLGLLSILFDKEILLFPICISVGIILIVALVLIIQRYKTLKKGEVTQVLPHNHQVTLIRKDYQLCADQLLHSFTPKQLESFVMVMGVDRTGLMAKNSKTGVAYYMMDYLDANYTVNGGTPREEIQRQIDEYKKEHHFEDKLPYRECMDIHLTLLPKEGQGSPIPCNLLMVVNSEKKSNGKGLINDGKGNLVIPTVYDHLHDSDQYESMLIPIIGSNGLEEPYLSIFSQIVNQLVWKGEGRKAQHIRHVYVAIREQDYQERWEVSLSQIESFLRACSEYYPKKYNQ